MKKKFMYLLFAGLFLCGCLFGEEIPGIPMFSDDFSIVENFAENWESSKGVKSEDGHVIIPSFNNITLRQIPEGDFVFTLDVILQKPVEAGFFGVKIGGWINFLISPSLKENAAIAHTAYRVPGEKHSRGKRGGKISDFEFGKPVRIMISRENISGDNNKYSYTVNGCSVDSFFAANPSDTGKIMFFAYKTPTVIVDNFRLYALKGTKSKNLVVNSSFEYLQEGMPLYMKPLTRRKFRFEGKWKDFINSFAIDTNEKVSGNQSVRMTLDNSFPGSVKLPSPYFSNGVGTHNVSVMIDKPVTFSVYLKASEDNFPVRLGIWELWYKGHSKNIKVSKEWKRYSFTVNKLEKKAIIRGNVTFKHPGTLWADDLQIEIGDKMTKYMPSSLDRDKFSKTKKIPVIEPDTVLKKTTNSPVIDGNLENLWFRYGVKIDKFFLLGASGAKLPPNRTETWMMCDDDNLYLAVRAYVPDTAKVKATKGKRDDLNAVHNGKDCIEVFFDTTFNRKTYYHLSANAAGSLTDFGPGRRMGWNGNWSVATGINEKEKAIDYEFKFPLENFSSLELANKWGLNIGRYDTATKRFYSLIHSAQVNFHLPSFFPAIVFPEGVLDKYRIGIKDIFLVPGKEDKVNISGTIGNLSGKPLNANVRISEVESGKILGSRKVKLANGDTKISFPVDIAENIKAVDVIVQVQVGKKVLLSQAKRLIVVQPLEIYTRYNYYMNEENAVLVGTLNFPDADKLTGRITIAGKTFTVKMEPEFAFDIPLKNIKNGEYKITLDVYKGKEKLMSRSTKLIKRKFKAGATQIDRQRRCLIVDGKPYLVIAPFFTMEPALASVHQDAVLRNMLRLHKEMGYRCFHVLSKEIPPYLEQKKIFYELCKKEGIKIINWSHTKLGASPKETFSTVVSDNIIAWMIIDEPELGGTPSEDVEAYLLAHQKASPYTPVYMNNSILGIPKRYANLETDILSIDDYLTNRENRKVVEMVNITKMMMEAGKEDRKPVFLFIACENLGNHYREPTYAEQVAQTYGVIITGATGVSYFCSLPYYPEDYRACVDVNRELLSLENVIFSLERTSEVIISDPAVISMTRRLNGKIYIIALNSDNDRTIDVEITLPAEFRYDKNAEVKFENRKVKVKKGRIYDTFQPLSRHVYVVNIVK